MTSDTYPSPADKFGMEQLMVMAGSLALRAEQWFRDGDLFTARATTADVAAVAQVYATLAFTQAVRDLPEQVAEALARELRAMDADQVSYGEVQ